MPRSRGDAGSSGARRTGAATARPALPAWGGQPGRPRPASPAGTYREDSPLKLPPSSSRTLQKRMPLTKGTEESSSSSSSTRNLNFFFFIMMKAMGYGLPGGRPRGSSAPATLLRSAPMPGARAGRAGAAAAASSAPAGRGAPGQRLHGSRRLPFKPARLRPARCRQRRPEPSASAAAEGSHVGVRFHEEVGPGREALEQGCSITGARPRTVPAAATWPRPRPSGACAAWPGSSPASQGPRWARPGSGNLLRCSQLGIETAVT